jgi:hypothetical protein
VYTSSIVILLILLISQSCRSKKALHSGCEEVLVFAGHVKYPKNDTFLLNPFFVFKDSNLDNNYCTLYYCKNIKRDTFLLKLCNNDATNFINKEIMVINDSSANCNCIQLTQLIKIGKRREAYYLA